MYREFVTQDEHALIQSYRALSPPEQEQLARYVEFIRQNQQAVNVEPIPVKKKQQ